nr:hypothetical protein [Rhizobium leguminosarum]
MKAAKSARAPAKPALPEGVQDHGPFQRRFWAAQRIAWLVFALILLACLLGLLGRGGPFSRHRIALPAGTLELPAISRWNAPDEMRVTLAPSPGDQTLFVDARFLEVFSIEGVDPPQKATVQRNGRIGYVFAADPSAPAKIVFRLHTEQVGLRSYFAGIGNDVSERTSLILP